MGICKWARVWYNAQKGGVSVKLNHVIDTLRCRCQELSRQYEEAYYDQRQEQGKSLLFYRYLVTYEIAYKLCTLTDRDFPDLDVFRQTVKELLPEHWDGALRRAAPEAAEYIREAEQAFLECLEKISPDCSQPEIPYCRNLVGQEAETVIARFREKWNYVPEKYWYPLTGPKMEEDKLFLPADYVEDYWAEIEKLLGLPENRIFSYGESCYTGIPACAEVAELVGYGGLEEAYCDRDFTWIIYFSHEDTVTFAGSILPGIRKILEPEREHWNRWE